MDFRPKQNKKATYTVSISLLICGLACILFAPFIYPKAVIQFLGIAFFTGSIFILTRYALQEFVYTLSDDGEGYDLTVNKIYGKRSQMVCKLALSTCVAFEKRQEGASLDKYGRVSGKYNYCVNFCAKEQYLFYFREDEESELCLLLLECDEAFAARIASIKSS